MFFIVSNKTSVIRFTNALLFFILLIFSIIGLVALSDKTAKKKNSCINMSINFDPNQDGKFTYVDVFYISVQIFSQPASLIFSTEQGRPLANFLEVSQTDCKSLKWLLVNILIWYILIKLIILIISIRINHYVIKKIRLYGRNNFWLGRITEVSEGKIYDDFLFREKKRLRDEKPHFTLIQNKIDPPKKEEYVEVEKNAPKILTNENNHSQPSDVRHEKIVLEVELKKLDSLIGLSEVKLEVRKLIGLARTNKKRADAGLPTSLSSLHLVFTGNPGTGKTTVARLIGRILAALDLLENGHLIETDRSGMVAGYIGHTAIQTKKVIESATGGVLFIDEAYALWKEDNTRDFGIEAIETLLKEMEDKRNKFCVIIAGYPKEMARLLSSNPGLNSRFTRYIRFEDYVVGDLHKILQNLIHEGGYQLDSAANHMIRLFLDEAYTRGQTQSGNGRYIRNLYGKIIEYHALRVDSTKMSSLTVISSDDVEQGFNDMKRSN